MRHPVTIVTPVYNGASTIRDCLMSVRLQSLPVEHVVVDGASTDGTLGLVEDHNARARVVSEPDHGVYDAMNKGLALATGEVIGILNADDFYPDSGILAKVAAVFEDPAVDCCYGDLIYVEEIVPTEIRELPLPRFHVKRYWEAGTFHPRKFYYGWMPPHPTFFVRRRAYERYGPFNLAMGSSADYELMLRLLLRHRLNAVYLPEVLVIMREGGISNTSWKNRLAAHHMDRKAWRVNDLAPLPWTMSLKPLRKMGQWLTKPPYPPKH